MEQRQIAYVINLDKRTDRWRSMNENWSDHFDLIRVSGIVLDNDERPQHIRAADGLGQTNMMLIREAVERGDKTLLIMEDDAFPEPNWFNHWKEIKEYLDNHLDDWEVFNGGAHQLKKCFDIIKLDRSALLNSDRCCASHFIYLNLRSANKFLNWENNKCDWDMWLCCTGFDLYCSYPILAKQADGHSDIINEERDWDKTYISNEIHFKRHLGDLYFHYNMKR
jgi:hypothetical protein